MMSKNTQMETKRSVLETLPVVRSNERIFGRFGTILVAIPPTTGIVASAHVLCLKPKRESNSYQSPWEDEELFRSSTVNAWILAEQRKLKHDNIFCCGPGEGLSAIGYDDCGYFMRTLRRVLETRYVCDLGPLEVARTKRMAVQVLRGLEHLHTVAHILHGDIKSSNILIYSDFETVKICNFGSSRPLDKDGFLNLQKYPLAYYDGTANWSAPEILPRKPTLVSDKADIFSFGLVIYETLTLMPPHTFPDLNDPDLYVDTAGATKCNDVSQDGNRKNCNAQDADKDTESGAVAIAATTQIISIGSDSSRDSACDTFNQSNQQFLGDRSSDSNIDEDDPFYSVGLLGSRPPLPTDIDMSTEHLPLIEIFHICTNAEPTERPTARQLIDALVDLKEPPGQSERKETKIEEKVPGSTSQ